MPSSKASNGKPARPSLLNEEIFDTLDDARPQAGSLAIRRLQQRQHRTHHSKTKADLLSAAVRLSNL